MNIILLQESIFNWYSKNGRHDLPWRNLSDQGIDVPYGVLVSEIMLQQTQVERVVPKYIQFLQVFPDVELITEAPSSEVIKLWSGLGYNRRAIMLQRAAQGISRECNGVFPDNEPALLALPGIGPYTAAAILSFGYNLPVVVSDTNILRFYELLFWGYTLPPAAAQREFLAKFVPPAQSRDWHSALMDLMSVVRTAKSPAEQQQHLLDALQIIPTWKLPKLNDSPLVRPKQSQFKGSNRYYRGAIIAHLTQQTPHKDKYKNLVGILTRKGWSGEPKLPNLLTQLRQDGLVVFLDDVTEESEIALP